MRKRYFDAHIHSSLSIGRDPPEKILEAASLLGFSSIALADFAMKPIEDFKKLKELGRKLGVDVVSRADIYAAGVEGLKKKIVNLRRRVELIAVYCDRKDIARFAARDRRVDILIFPYEKHRNFFDQKEASIASESGVAFEVNINSILKATGIRRVITLNLLRKNVELALRKKASIIIASGAKSIYEMRGPRELISLATLTGLNENQADEAISITPENIVSQNRSKLQPNYVMPGVRVLMSQ